MLKTYTGECISSKYVVTRNVNGCTEGLAGKFSWGSIATSSTELALFLLQDSLGNYPSEFLVLEFKKQFVAQWGDNWSITDTEVIKWCNNQFSNSQEVGGVLELVNIAAVEYYANAHNVMLGVNELRNIARNQEVNQVLGWLDSFVLPDNSYNAEFAPISLSLWEVDALFNEAELQKQNHIGAIFVMPVSGLFELNDLSNITTVNERLVSVFVESAILDEFICIYFGGMVKKKSGELVYLDANWQNNRTTFHTVLWSSGRQLYSNVDTITPNLASITGITGSNYPSKVHMARHYQNAMIFSKLKLY